MNTPHNITWSFGTLWLSVTLHSATNFQIPIRTANTKFNTQNCLHYVSKKLWIFYCTPCVNACSFKTSNISCIINHGKELTSYVIEKWFQNFGTFLVTENTFCDVKRTTKMKSRKNLNSSSSLISSSLASSIRFLFSSSLLASRSSKLRCSSRSWIKKTWLFRWFPTFTVLSTLLII